MWHFLAGVVVGGLIMTALASTHPDQAKAALKSGADHITAGVSAGASAASSAVDQHFGSK